jgi:hypothetical protein
LIISAKQDNVAVSDKFCISAKNNLQEPEFSPAALCSIPFSNAVGEKYIFLNHRNGFLECDGEFVLVFLKRV